MVLGLTIEVLLIFNRIVRVYLSLPAWKMPKIRLNFINKAASCFV